MKYRSEKNIAETDEGIERDRDGFDSKVRYFCVYSLPCDSFSRVIKRTP